MTSKEIIKRLIAHDEPPRFGYDFKSVSDFKFCASRAYIDLPPNPYNAWGNYPELSLKSGFKGETRMDVYGNIYGRFEGKTKGECVRGVIQDWEDYEYYIPKLDPTFRERVQKQCFDSCDRFVVASGYSIFSALRDARLMPNALADTILDPEAVTAFIDRITAHEVEAIKIIAGSGIDGWMFADDWGTQERTFISPESFRELFKPAYKRLADAAHEAGMKVIMHSCGYNYSFMEDLLDAGVDVFQFDQPDAYPTEVLAKEFAHRAVFYSPVDIQKVLPTGDRELIESRALEMCRLFREAGGGWIAKDYPAYGDIGVNEEWAKWASDVIVQNSKLGG